MPALCLAVAGMWVGPAAAQVAEAGAGPPSGLEFVAVTDEDIAHFGDFPFSRAISATVIHRLAQAGARSIVYKFFVDEPRDADAQLATALARIPSFLQIDLADVVEGPDGLMHGSAVGPNSRLAPAAAGFGFVHQRAAGAGESIEVQAQVNGRTVQSLSLLAAQELVRAKAVITPSELRLGPRRFVLDGKGQARCFHAQQPVPEGHSFRSVVDGSRRFLARFRDKVVVIGHMASNTPRLAVGQGRELPVHAIFLQQVACLAASP